MKNSIKFIFQNLNTYMFFVMFVSFIFMVISLEKELYFSKLENLENQKKIVSSLTKLNKKDLELALIQFNGKTAQINSEITKLHNIYKYSITEKYLINNQTEYMNDLEILSRLINIFNTNAKTYYVDTKDRTKEKADKLKLQKSFYTIMHQIDLIKERSIVYSQETYNIFKYLFIVSFVLIFLATLWYRNRMNRIYKDITHLMTIDHQTKAYTIYTREADAISLRMKKRNIGSNNPEMVDKVTEINNYKGLMSSYAQKKGMKDSFFTSVTILEIDNFSKSKRTYPQDLTQAILKKIAFTITLYERPTDIIARTDYNQFTIILSRETKEQAFKDADTIRQSISELRFNTPDKANITTTGGFIIKPNNTSLEEAIRQAKDVLENTVKIGRNRIVQAKDLNSTLIR